MRKSLDGPVAKAVEYVRSALRITKQSFDSRFNPLCKVNTEPHRLSLVPIGGVQYIDVEARMEPWNSRHHAMPEGGQEPLRGSAPDLDSRSFHRVVVEFP